MKIGIISDIHSNKVALNKVLEDMPEVDKLVCLGDIVGYGPWPSECVEIVRKNCDISILGNHDRTLNKPQDFMHNELAYEGILHSKEELTEEQKNWVTNLPVQETVDDYMLVHSHPEFTDRYVRPALFSYMGKYIPDDKDGLFMGHTHIQGNKYVSDGSLVLNPGSVGQPRDDNSEAAYSIVDSNSNTVESYRVSYDIEEVIGAVNNCGLPEFIGERLKTGH